MTATETALANSVEESESSPLASFLGGGFLRRGPSGLWSVLFTVLFAALGLLSEWFRPATWDIPALSLQTAFLQLVLVVFAFTWWPRLILLSIAIRLLFLLLAEQSLGQSGLLALSDLLTALGGACFARFLLSYWRIGEYRRLFATLLSCAFVGPLVGVAVISLARGLSPDLPAFNPGVQIAYLSWLLGALVLAPFPLAWAQSCQAEWRAAVLSRRAEALILAIITPLLAAMLGFIMPSYGLELGALLLLPLLYSAARFDFAGAAYACSMGLLLLLGVTSFIAAGSPDTLLRVQLLSGLIASVTLFVAGYLEMQKRASRKLLGLHDSTTELVASFEVVYDSEGRPGDLRFLDVNPAFTLITGYPKELAIGALATQLYETDSPPHMAELVQMMQDGKPISFETFLPKAKRHLKATAFPTDRRNRFCIVATDVTQLRERELESTRANRMYSVLSQINQSIVRSHSRTDLLNCVCKAFVESGVVSLCYAVWRNTPHAPTSLLALSGSPESLPRELERAPGFRAESQLGEISIAEDRTIICTNFALDPIARAWGELAVSFGLHTAAAFPLRLKADCLGAVVLFSKQEGALSTKELSLFNSAAQDISHALENLQLEALRAQALEALEISEQRFRSQFEKSPVAYVALDSKGLITDANPSWTSLVVQMPGDAIGNALMDYIRPLFRRHFTDAYASLVLAGGDRSLELELDAYDGSVRSVIFSLRVEVSAQNEFKGAHCIVFNITDRKRYEDAVRVSEQRLTQAFEIANDGIWELNLLDRSLYLSKRFYAMLGVDSVLHALEFVGWRDLVHSDDLKAFDSIFARFSTNETNEISLEFRLRGARHRWLWVLIRGRIVEQSREGQPLRVLGTISDITERRNAEEGLRETALKYRSYIDESPMAICLLAGDGLLLEANPSFRLLFTLPESDWDSLTLLDLLDPISHEAYQSFVDVSAKEGRASAELRGRRRKGGLLFLTLQAVQIASGRHLVFCVDSTARRRAEQALQARESMLESILSTALDGFWILDSNGTLIEVNDTYCRTSDYSQKELLQMRVGDLEALESASALQQHLARIRRSGSDRWETAHRRKDGTLIDVEISATFLPIEDGRFVVFIQNITDRKKAESALRQSQRQLSLIIEGSALAAWDWDLGRGEIYFNSNWGKMLGHSEADCSIRQQSWIDLIHPKDRPQVALAFNEHLEGKSVYFDCEYRVRNHDGHWSWIIDRGQVIIRDSAGKPLRATGTQRDVTARKIAEDRVRQQAALLNQTRDIIIAADTDGVVLLCNRSAEDAFACEPGCLEGSLLSDLFTEADPQINEAWLARVLAEGSWLGELSFGPGSHQDKIWDTRWSVVSSSGGGANSLLIVATDVSEKRMLESRFLRSQRMESLGAIATGVAHDLNNIFLPISLAANMLRGAESLEQRASLHLMIDQSAQRGAEVVSQLLTFGRGLDGRRIEMQPALLIQEVRRIMIETFPKNLSTDCRVADDLWTINADPTQIHQVLLNLCVNARDSMPAGGVLTLVAENMFFDEYYAAMNPEAEQGPYIALQVSDTGCGIAPEHLERIFDPFFTTKEPGMGTGLGLSTVHGIVRGNGGFVQVRSKLGQGSTFMIYLPAIPSVVEVDESNISEEIPDGNGETILVVDDEDAVRQSLKHLLESSGYRCLSACDGKQGLVCYVQSREKLRAIITDVMMPVMDGTELIKAVRRISTEIPILAMSGLPEKEPTSSDGLANRFLPKPFVSSQLLRELHQLLKSSLPTNDAHS